MRVFINKQDLKAMVLLGLLFVLMVAGSWQRWTQPIIDHGREMNLPARILAGEQLYADVQYLYGPFAPYFNAALYYIFGVRLAVLHAAGALCGALIILIAYWLSRRLMSVWESALVAGMVIVVCAVKSTANYISPYSFAALYALVFALLSLVAVVRYLESGRGYWMPIAGALVGLTLITKLEVSGASMAVALTAIGLRSLGDRRLHWRDLILFALPLIVISGGVLGLILTRVSWRTLLDENHIFFSNMPPQLYYFNQSISGLLEWRISLWFTLAGVCSYGIWLAGSAIVGMVSGRRLDGRLWLKSLAWAISSLGLYQLITSTFNFKIDPTPLAAAPIILPVLILSLGGCALKAWIEKRSIPIELKIALLVVVFAQVSILRVILNVTGASPYTPFFIPTVLVIIIYLLFRTWPALFTTRVEIQDRVRTGAMILIGVMILGTGVNSIYRLRTRHNYQISAPRGRFLTEAPIGQPLSAAIQFVRERTSPDQEVLTLPQATSINFLAERRYPFREEILHPGFVTGEHEKHYIELIKKRRYPLILVVNLLTPEFRDRIFGVDYNQELMSWIESNYQLTTRFDSDWSKGLKMGDQLFFILAYEPKSTGVD